MAEEFYNQAVMPYFPKNCEQVDCFVIIYNNEIQLGNYEQAQVVYVRCVAGVFPDQRCFYIQHPGGSLYRKTQDPAAEIHSTMYSTRKDAEEALKYMLDKQHHELCLKLQKVKKALYNLETNDTV